MTTPHTHAQILKHWADGRAIEVKMPGGRWEPVDATTHMWGPGREYRLVPVIIRYRRWLARPYDDRPNELGVSLTWENPLNRDTASAESIPGFFKWLDDDWITTPLEVLAEG